MLNRIFIRHVVSILLFATGIGSAEGIAYDPLMRQIYWTSYTNSSIGRLMIDEPTKEEVLVRLTAGDHPRGIALDYCHR